MIDPYKLQFDLIDTYFVQKPFTLKDTGVTNRQLCHWDERGLLLSHIEKGEWHRFNVVDLVWIRLIIKLRQFHIGLDLISEIKKELTEPVILADYFSAEKMDSEFLIVKQHLKNSGETAEDIEEGMQAIKETPLPPLYFLTLGIVTQKTATSILIYTTYDEQTNRYENKTKLFSTDLLEELLKADEEYASVLRNSFLCISLNELLTDIFEHVAASKLMTHLVNLNDSEQQLLAYVRSGKYSSIKVRFNAEKEPHLLEATEEKKLKMESRLLDIIHNKGYQDIEITTVKGEIYMCKNTIKVKL